MTAKLHYSIPLLLRAVCAPVVQSRVQTTADRFTHLDNNGDGKLTREEFPVAKIFDAADADKDGFLTREEIAAYFRKQQSGTTTTPTTPTAPPSKPTKQPIAGIDVRETRNVP